jgi:hypothetical protein
LQKLVRLKAADLNGICECVTCGVKKHYKMMDGGHFYGRTHRVFMLMEEQINPQCKACNMFNMKRTRTQERYRIYMEDMYGVRRIKAMNRLSFRDQPKFKMSDVLAFKTEVKKQIRSQLIRLGEYKETQMKLRYPKK